ncbi:MAG: branched-chain amino acid aminotransferase [Clostridia bacterium]
MKIQMNLSKHLKAKPTDESKLGFGNYFSDHMLMINYTEGKGWHDARIEPYGNLSLDPACQVLHYGQEIFEGMKCYRTPENGFNLFRPTANFERMARSSERMGMAKLPVEEGMESLLALLNVEKEWTPHQEGTSLYIRPTMIALDAHLGVSASKTYLYYVILSPSGAYYAAGLAPVGIYVEDSFVRAVRGGIGFAKTGGNYAASILASVNAKQSGYAQVLWLDGVEQRYIEEVGAMNMMFVYGDERIVTPSLNGSILPGITRDSVLKLSQKLGYRTEETKMDIHAVIEDIKAGKITEAFGTGTAAVVSPVNKICFKSEEVGIGDGGIGKTTMQLYNTLTGIQFGKSEDPLNWIVKVQ